MNRLRSKVLALTVATFGMAAVLGGSLGLATAGSKNLVAGYNQIGGPVGGDVKPANYVKCLNTNSWKAIYIWQSSTQEWKHYFNTAKGVPSYVNDFAVGGMRDVPFGSGVIIIMDSAVSGAFFPDNDSQSCPA